MESLINDAPEDSIHVFSSMVHNSTIRAIFKKATMIGAIIGVLSEGRDWRGFRGWLRLAQSVLHERRYRGRVDFVLAIGSVGMKWFARCGYPPSKLFPFSYATESDDLTTIQNPPGSPVRLTAVGQLIPRKRFDLLLLALSGLRMHQWNLRIIGDGEERHRLEILSAHLGLKDRTVFTGVLDNTRVRREQGNADILVLGSKWDGWGAVVNEALMSGVPVICSDYCGAADLIHDSFNGETFRCDSLESLTGVLEKWILKGPLDNSKREQIRSWSRCIEGDVIARYVLEIIGYLENGGGQRPQPPWLLQNTGPRFDRD